MTSQSWIFALGTSLLFACGQGSIGNQNPPHSEIKGDDPSTPTTASEACNGFDDNGDGNVDEGCHCTPGATQACFPAPPQQVAGSCVKGEQRCEGDAGGEFGVWGPCVGATPLQQEICGDGIDQDCDGSDAACSQCETFTFGMTGRATDIIFIVDQSGSMNADIAMIKQKLNDFVYYMENAAQIDYRVVMLAARGTDANTICIPQPLAGPACADGPRFKQIDQMINSHDSLLRFKERIGEIESFLRPHSMRHVVEVSDDDSSLGAQAFDSWLRVRPGFGDYMFHSVVGLHNDACVAEIGRAYDWLAVITQGLEFHICGANWTNLFVELGQKVADVATTQYPLSEEPAPGSLQVKIGGVVATSQVSYDEEAHSIELAPPYPVPGTTIEACYDY